MAWGKMSWGKMSFGEKCHMGKNVMGKFVMGKNGVGKIVIWGKMLQSHFSNFFAFSICKSIIMMVLLRWRK